MRPEDYTGFYGHKPNCMDCAKYFYGCQWIDGERYHPDRKRHEDECYALWETRRRERKAHHDLDEHKISHVSPDPMAGKSGMERRMTENIKPIDDVKARELMYKFGELDARKKRIELEQSSIKDKLTEMMRGAKLDSYTDSRLVASFVPKHTYQFDIETIVKVVPSVMTKLKLTNEEFNKILVGHEQEIGACRKVTNTETNLVIRQAKGR